MTGSTEPASRGLVRSMLVIGSAQAVNIVVSVIRVKVVALLLGPTGIGVMGLYNSLKEMAVQAAGLGMGSSGVREIAVVRDEEERLSLIRRLLFVAHLIAGTLALMVIWLMRVPISIWLFDDTTRATEVALVGLVVLLGLLATSQLALLQGLRRIDELGKVTVTAVLASTATGLLMVWWLDEAGLIWLLMFQPLATVTVAAYFTRRLPKRQLNHWTPLEMWHAWTPMAKLGLSFMLGGLATTGTVLIVRGTITQELGLEATGHFTAAWAITITYVGFLLSAMSADYYPRLTEVIKNRPAAIRLINDQSQLGLAIGGPILLLLIGWSHWVIVLLYTEEFTPAVTLLQWQLVGNVFKLASWPLSYSIVAAGRAKTFFFLEVVFNVVFIALVFLFLPSFGLQVTGIAFLVAYIVYFVCAWLLARNLHAFTWDPVSRLVLGVHAVLAFALLPVAFTFPIATALVAPVLAVSTGLFSLRLVLIKIGPEGRLSQRLTRAYAFIGWPINGTS